MNSFTLTVKHDYGKDKFTFDAENEKAAIERICKLQNCPPCAVIKVKDNGKTLYKVLKVFNVSRRREILARNLTEQEAQRKVKSYPDSSRSMVIYSRQNNFQTI